MIKYKSYKNLIYKTAKSWSLKTGVEIEEFVSLGNLIFTEATNRYIPGKYTFGAYFRRCLNNGFMVYIKKQSTKKAKREININPSNFDGYTAQSANPERYCMFVDCLKTLSEEARMVINIVMEAPGDLLSMMPHGRISKSWLKKYLNKSGWKTSVIDNCFDEIKEAIKI